MTCRESLKSVVRYEEIRIVFLDCVGEIGLGIVVVVVAGARTSYRDDDLLIGRERGCRCCGGVEGREERWVNGEEGRDGGDCGERRS